MSDIIIEHPDGRRYGTTSEGFKRLKDTDYDGFTVVGDEVPADFIVTGVPEPKRARRRPAAKRAAAPAAAPIASSETPGAPAEAEG